MAPADEPEEYLETKGRESNVIPDIRDGLIGVLLEVCRPLHPEPGNVFLQPDLHFFGKDPGKIGGTDMEVGRNLI